MKIACSSASFARAIADGTLTQLEWLDLCANELEVDGVVFDVEHFPRVDAEYLAQLKKAATDLGLTIAAVASRAAFASDDDACLEFAIALGAPLAIVDPPAASDDARAWGAFADAVKTRAGAAKACNVTLALRNAPGSLCPTVADLRRIAKDVDSAWLRFAIEATGLADDDDARALTRTAIAFVTIADLATFATTGDRDAADAIDRLARFRGFVVFDGTPPAEAPAAYHDALARFAARRAFALAGRE